MCIAIIARPIAKRSVPLGGSCSLESNGVVENLQQRRQIVRSTTNQLVINKIGNSSVRLAGVAPLEMDGAPFKNVPQKQGAKVTKRRLSNVFPATSLVPTFVGSVQTKGLLQNSSNAEVEISQTSSSRKLERKNSNLFESEY